MPGKNFKPKVSPARRAALEVGTSVRTRRAFTQDVIAAQIDTSDLSPEDRAFATRLALGVTSALGTLDELIDRFVRAPQDLEANVRDALRISCYEIIFLEKSGYAAVDQGVELVKCVNPKASGLANAVLRKIAGAKKEFPFGDPKSDGEALARLYAFPAWMTAKLVSELGYNDACMFMEASNEPAPLFIAVNSLKASEEEVEKVFAQIGEPLKRIALSDEPVKGCFLVRRGKSLQDPLVKALFDDGKLLVSDAASQFIAEHVLPTSYAESYLEVGAGRGTKSLLLQSNAMRQYGKQIPLQVLDNHDFKVKLLEKRASVYGAHIERSHVADARDLGKLFSRESFDSIFIDAPCSGLGTLRRHPEIRWRIKPSDIVDLAELGYSMLVAAAPLIKPGGLLVYATCTVTSEENQELVKRFCASEAGKGFRLDPIAGKACFASRLYPGSSDAHFAVRLVRAR